MTDETDEEPIDQYRIGARPGHPRAVELIPDGFCWAVRSRTAAGGAHVRLITLRPVDKESVQVFGFEAFTGRELL